MENITQAVDTFQFDWQQVAISPLHPYKHTELTVNPPMENSLHAIQEDFQLSQSIIDKTIEVEPLRELEPIAAFSELTCPDSIEEVILHTKKYLQYLLTVIQNRIFVYKHIIPYVIIESISRGLTNTNDDEQDNNIVQLSRFDEQIRENLMTQIYPLMQKMQENVINQNDSQLLKHLEKLTEDYNSETKAMLEEANETLINNLHTSIAQTNASLLMADMYLTRFRHAIESSFQMESDRLINYVHDSKRQLNAILSSIDIDQLMTKYNINVEQKNELQELVNGMTNMLAAIDAKNTTLETELTALNLSLVNSDNPCVTPSYIEKIFNKNISAVTLDNRVALETLSLTGVYRFTGAQPMTLQLGQYTLSRSYDANQLVRLFYKLNFSVKSNTDGKGELTFVLNTDTIVHTQIITLPVNNSAFKAVETHAYFTIPTTGVYTLTVNLKALLKNANANSNYEITLKDICDVTLLML
ncbi:hypothetical protein [Scale drop disease virus]|uniref:Uncharacterized protein n=1 Tax=Scale drop disease virus TaxID=1697349 RepID=A0A7D5YFY0_9VIRU|nr:hypothetical protein [Scale drop disease virus]QXJ13586.1 hypothetical protein PMJGCIOK_00019 [Scale drop disease virus]UNH60786.1 hypothetical protein SDDV_ORF117 [Scale drop disease virus]